MTVNRTSRSLEEVEEDVEDLTEEVKEDDIIDSHVQETLHTINIQLKHIQEDLKNLKKHTSSVPPRVKDSV